MEGIVLFHFLGHGYFLLMIYFMLLSLEKGLQGKKLTSLSL